jgi:hypothetical protein
MRDNGLESKSKSTEARNEEAFEKGIDVVARDHLYIRPGAPLFYGCFVADARFCVPRKTVFSQTITNHEGSRLNVKTETAWSTLADGMDVPSALITYAFCTASSLGEASKRMYQSILTRQVAMAVCANAWCEAPRELWIADMTSGLRNRRIRRRPNMMPTHLPQPTRQVDVGLCHEFACGIGRKFASDARMYAAEHYVDALDRLRVGNDLAAVEHLFIAAEALKTPFLEAHLEASRLTRAQLAEKWQTRTKYLEAEARLRLVFQCNQDVAEAASSVSNDFEHATKMSDETRLKAAKYCLRIARSVRDALIRSCAIGEASAKFLNDVYGEPLFDTELEAQTIEVRTTRAKIVAGTEPSVSELAHQPFASQFDDATSTFQYTVGWRDAASPGISIPFDEEGVFTAFTSEDAGASVERYIAERLSGKRIIVEPQSAADQC